MSHKQLAEPRQLPHSRQSLLIWSALVATFAILLVLVPENRVLPLGVLLIGAPLALLVLNASWRGAAVVLLLGLLPFTGILKAVTGSRFAPLTFDLGLLFACLLHLGAGLLRGKLRAGKLDLALGALWLLALIQIFNPNVPNLMAGVEGFRKFAFMSIAFYVGRHMLSARDIRRLQQLFLLVGGLVCLYGVKQFIVLWPIDLRMVDLSTSATVTFFMGGWIRPFSTMSGPFHLGLYLIVASLLTVGMILRTTAWDKRRLWLIALLVLQLLVLIMTRTKGNWVGFVAGMVVLLFFQYKGFLRSLLRMSRFAIVLVAFVSLVLLLSSGTVANVLTEAVAAVTNPLQSRTFIFRLALWEEEMLPALWAHPLRGYGTSSAGEGLHVLYDGTSSAFFFSHNLFLKVWLELGLLGLLLFVFIVGSAILLGLRHLALLKGRQNHPAYLTYQWSLAVVMSFLVAGIVIATLDAYPANYYFWMLLGFLTIRQEDMGRTARPAGQQETAGS